MKFFAFLLFSGFIANLTAQDLFDKEINKLIDPSSKPFCFGVASGDPQQNSVVIWTKVLNDSDQTVAVNWEIATDSAMKNVVAGNEFRTSFSSAYTVKLQVKNLQPATTYFYRFETGNIFSPIGRTKTAPLKSNQLRFAVVSCNNFEHGYFNAYHLLANRNDIDAVIHLGDYIYEYGANKNKKHKSVRQHIPEHEILNLQDYRSRYAQYRLDKDLQEAHRLHPFINVWDDHEFANDAYKEGAKNQQADEGDWNTRKATAKKVYFEWIPIVDNAEESVIRKISYGSLADVFMIDTRVEERCKQVGPYDTLLQCTTRTILGAKQTAWLTQGVEHSVARWKVIANQVVFSELDAHQLTKKSRINADAWDGYPEERKELFDSFYANNTRNIIIVTGDIHLAWAFDLVLNPTNKNKYDRKTGKGVIGAEYVVPSVTSNGLGERIPRGLAKIVELILKRKSTNPHLQFQNLVDHGYMLLDLNNERANATWYFCKTVRKRTEKFSDKDSWSTKWNENRLVKEK